MNDFFEWAFSTDAPFLVTLFCCFVLIGVIWAWLHLAVVLNSLSLALAPIAIPFWLTWREYRKHKSK